MMSVHPSGYYSWKRSAGSARTREDQCLLGLIRHSWLESGGIYGYRKVHANLRELGLICVNWENLAASIVLHA